MKEIKKEVQRNRIDIYSTVLLGMAAFAVAWCSYQSNLWSGIQSFRLVESNASYRHAQENEMMVAQQQQIDAAIAINLVIAVVDDKRDRINFYMERSKYELAPIMKKWLALDPLHNKQAPPNPLEMEEYKKLQKDLLAKSDSATFKGDMLWREAQHANETSDTYVLLTVIFNLVLFLCAIAPKMGNIKISGSFVIVAGVIFFIALVLVIGYMPLAKE